MFLKVLLLILLPSGASLEARVIDEFHKLDNEANEIQFIRKYGKEESLTIQGYVCAIEMKQAIYPFNPFKKLAIFNASKLRLDELVKKGPDNIHLRYLRYYIQTNCPIFLGYRDAMPKDGVLLNKYMALKGENDVLTRYIKKNCHL